MERDANGSTLPTANKTPVCRSLSVYKQRGQRGNVALFYSWKRSDRCYQLVAGSAWCNIANARGMGTATLYTRQTKYLFADLWLFTSREGEEATSPSYVARNKAIDASSSPLEALFATWYMQMGCDGSTLPRANKTLVCQSLSVYKRRGRRGNVALFYNWKRSNWCFQLVTGSAHCN